MPRVFEIIRVFCVTLVYRVRIAFSSSGGKKFQKLVRELKSRGAVIAIDITPGRRALIAAALIPAMKMNIDHIYYLAIHNTDDAAKPYMMIPLKYQKVYCFMDAARGIEE